MQISIDTNTDTPAEMRVALQALIALIALDTACGSCGEDMATETPIPTGTPAHAAPVIWSGMNEAPSPSVQTAIPLLQGMTNEQAHDAGAAAARAAFGEPVVVTEVPEPPAPPSTLTIPSTFVGAIIEPEDINGISWDARIHSETRNKNKDGSWRNKRGVDPAILAAVTAELKANANTVSVPPPPPSTDTRAVAQQPAANQQVAPLAEIPAPPADNAGSVPPPPSVVNSVPPGPAAQSMTFKALMQESQNLMKAGKLNNAALNAIVKSSTGLDSLTSLFGKSDLCQKVWEALKVELKLS